MIDALKPDFDNTPVSASRPGFGYQPIDTTATPSVSIITPYFNTGVIFRETAQTVLNQSFQQWEWLIINDGSDDTAALETLDLYRTADPRIRVIDHANRRGSSAARNTGCALANSDYVVLLDSDDLLEPTALEKWLWHLETHPNSAFVKGYSVSFGGQRHLGTRGFDGEREFLQSNLMTLTAMARRAAIETCGGFDTAMHGGLEDWDFWLRAASAGLWGSMVPEFLDWYRRRPTHSDRWRNWNSAGIRHFREQAQLRFPGLWQKNGFPSVPAQPPVPFSVTDVHPTFQNRLTRNKPRALFIVPWMEIGGADRVNIDWIASLISHGYEVSVCATLKARQSWYSQFTALTPDVFVLPNFLPLSDMPRFLAYLIRSRQIETVFITNSTLGYLLLPFLRSRCPDAVFLDISHVEEPHWLNGGHPRFGVGYQDLLDLNITTTGNLRDWMMSKGADRARIAVCHTGAASHILERPLRSNDISAANASKSTKVRIVFAARFSTQKRPLMVVEILRRLRTRNLDFHCTLIGDGELRPTIARNIRRAGLQAAVTLAGAMDHDSCLSQFAASDILLLPSAYEGISVALFEAMASGLVPVVSNVGGHSEVITAAEGFLINLGPHEVDEYVDALTRLITAPEVRSVMAKAARQRIAASFTLEQGVEALLSAISRAHMLAKTAPRHQLPASYAMETASLAVEYTRMTTSVSGPSTMARLVKKMRRHSFAKRAIDNWLTSLIVRKFGHTRLIQHLRDHLR